MQKYEINKYSVESILNWVKTGEVSIPEIQRPFVWDSKKVRDLYGVSNVHHIFPKSYLQKVDNLNMKSIYNQVANYARTMEGILDLSCIIKTYNNFVIFPLFNFANI